MKLSVAHSHVHVYVQSSDTSQNNDRGVSVENGNDSYLITGVKT